MVLWSDTFSTPDCRAVKDAIKPKGGRGFSAAAHSFKMEPLARPIFVKVMTVIALARPRGNPLIFFRTPPLKSQKNHIQIHKVTRKITNRKHQKSQIIEKLLKNHTEKSLEITKITKHHRKKSCDFKITKISYAILRSYLPLGLFLH